MTRRFLLLAAAGLLLASPAVAADGKRAGYTLVFLGDARPVVLRVHLQVDGQPVEANRLGFIDRLFTYLDRDEDGVLTMEETERVPRADLLAQLRTGNFFNFNNGRGVAATMGELDRDKDGKVSREELDQYYAQGGLSNLQFAPQFNQPATTSMVNEELLKALDRNHDGKLSEDEVAGAMVALARFDQNDDELISLQEIAPGPNGFGQFPVVQRFGQAGAPPSNFALFGAAATARAAATQVVNTYDKDKNQKLSRSEFGVDKVVFDLLDANQDDELDAAEVAQIASLPTEMEFLLRLGKTDGMVAGVEFCSPAGRPLPPPAPVRRVDANALTVTLASAVLELRRDNTLTAQPNFRQNILQQFKAADTNKDGLVDEKEATGRFQFLMPYLQLADRNRSGTLSEMELTLFLDVQDYLTTSNLMLRVTDNSQGLFDVLDANRDGNLSQRELRSAWQRLLAWDQNKDGVIERSEIPRQIQLAVNQGQPSFGRAVPPVALRGVGGPPVPPAPTKGPVWFRKMDRNGDGDVSLREFLGGREDFKRIDLDGDGLIDLAEAEKADAALRQK